MQASKRIRTATFLSLSIALSLISTGCLKGGEDAAGTRPDPLGGLDDGHGGARIVLPDIDPAALGKSALDSALPPDTSAQAWFELAITGENMAPMYYKYPLPARNGSTLEITGIPAGKGRSFHGSLFNRNHVLTHEGVTLADIRGGAFTSVRLFLAKASGSASVCVVIEGQKLPPCAGTDSLPPMPPPWPNPDSSAIGGCWIFSSGWISGNLSLYPSSRNGIMGSLRAGSGETLPITTWARRGDTLLAILISPDPDVKWLIQGIVTGWNVSWTGLITNYATGKTDYFNAKTVPCDVISDPDTGGSDSIPVPPNPDPGTPGSIPMPGNGVGQATLCFEMRFDYADTACEIQGYAKMEFQEGRIPYGNMVVADRPARDYPMVSGRYDSSAISFYGVTSASSSLSPDTLSLQGRIGAGATMAKGEYLRLPSGKKGIWTMKVVSCGSFTPKSPAPSCPSAKSP